MTVIPIDAVVPIDALVGHRQRFKCLPLTAVLSAGTCLLKQQQARTVTPTPDADPPPCLHCLDGRRVQARIDSSQEKRAVEDVTPANTHTSAQCVEPGCEKPPGNVRRSTPPDLTGYCLVHRKKRIDAKRWSKEGRAAAKKAARKRKPSPASKPAARTPAPASLSIMDPAVLADLHAVCVDAGRTNLAVVIGTALAASVRGGKS